MERDKDGPPQAPDAGAIDLSQVDDEVSVLVRNRASSKASPEKPGSRLAAFLRATKPSSNKAPPSEQNTTAPGPRQSAIEQAAPAKQWPPSRPQAQAQAHQPRVEDEAPAPAIAPASPPEPSVSSAQRSKIEQAPAKVWPPARESASDSPAPEAGAEGESEQVGTPSRTDETSGTASEAKAADAQPTPNDADASPIPDTADARRSADASPIPDPADTPPTPKTAAPSPSKQSSSLADYLPPGMRQPAQPADATLPSWPPPRQAETEPLSPKLDPQDIPQDLPAIARGPKANTKPGALAVPAAPPARSLAFSALTNKLSKSFAALRERASTWSQRRAAKANQLGSGFPVLPASTSDSEAETSPSEATRKTAPGPERPFAPSRAPAPSVRTYPVVPPAAPELAQAPSVRTYPAAPPAAPKLAQAPSVPAYPVAPPAAPEPAQAPSAASPPQRRNTAAPLATPRPAQVPAAFVRTKPRTPPAPRLAEPPAAFVKTKAPSAAQDSGLGTFKRRQTPQQPRRRKQHSYRNTNVAPDSKLGLHWWFHHFSAVTWLGRSLWAGAFICAWVALSRCLDPAVSDPKLSQVPYLALLGWLLCAGLALNQRIPSRFRWTGLILGAANSVALALSWSFRLHQL